MCFSAAANFTGSAVLGVIGVGDAVGSEASSGDPLCFVSAPVRAPPIYRRFVWLGLDGVCPPQWLMMPARPLCSMHKPYCLYCYPWECSCSSPRRRGDAECFRLLCWVIVLGLYVLWALAAFPTHVFLEKNSIVYMNPATHHGVVALLYVVATCGSLFFSKVKDMVVFGIANLLILLTTIAVKEYAFTSIWCAYAAIASVIIWFGFRHSSRARPFQYNEAS